VRICDIPLRAEESIAIAALIQATAATLWRLHSLNVDYRQYSRALLMENKFRAVRYGLDGKLIDFRKQEEVPLRLLIDEYLNFVGDEMRALGSEQEIGYVCQMLEQGSGADRQLKVFREAGSVRDVVDYGTGDAGRLITATALPPHRTASERQL